ncbi:GP4 protein [Rat arterivirus 1]|uniref:GP4 protein n=1 Tax=RtMruf arterivirus TaxID=2847275 RepID=A0A0U2M3U1_9NIDO|nr:GP4 protein [Rat arterivirus 1]ALI16782.1 GP4 protein [Rat arterivirus 1]
MASALLFLLVGAQHCLVSQAFACKPCFSTSLSDIKTNTTAAAGFAVIQDIECMRYHWNPNTMAPGSPIRKRPQCRTAIGTPQYITITANVTDEACLYNSDLLMLSACMFYASEMSEKGFKVVFGNVSGVVSACVNFTDYVQHITQFTKQSLAVDHIRLLHFLTPEVMRWATTIACVVAILLSI